MHHMGFSRFMVAVILAVACAEDPEKTRDGSKMAAVEKVTSMLEELKAKVLKEGEEEAKSYDKFACFCKDTTSEKTESIQEGQEAKETLTAEINELASGRTELDTQIESLTGEIAEADKEVEEAKAARSKALKEYQANEADLASALYALEKAIKSLKASKSPSLAQLRAASETAAAAASVADALGLVSASRSQQQIAVLLQEAPEVGMESYKFHSGSIIETLEGLLAEFTKKKDEVDADEVKAVAEHDSLMQERTGFINDKTDELETAKKDKAVKQEDIASKSQALTSVAASLMDDEQYLKELSAMCAAKAAAWDQRTSVRADELNALTSAIEIIKGSVTEKTSAATVRLLQSRISMQLARRVAQSEGSMEAVEAEVEAQEASAGGKRLPGLAFLQKSRKHQPLGSAAAQDGRQAVADLLRGQGLRLKSALLTSLASEVADDPLAKVKKLIEELIQRLLKQSTNEADQKGWCDKSLAEAKQRRDSAAAAVRELNGEMTRLEALTETLQQDLKTTTKAIEELETNKEEAVTLREGEKSENDAAIAEAKDGLAAVKKAIQILDEFYKTADKSEVALVQQGPVADAPDAGFGSGEAYKGSQGAAKGVLGMLDIIKSDFQRTITETQLAEEKAGQDHLEFMTETGKSLAEKNVDKEAFEKQYDDADAKLTTSKENLESQTDLLGGAVKELLELKPACIDTGMSYEERVKNREEEISSLKKALCVLENFAKYGPDGAGDAC